MREHERHGNDHDGHGAITETLEQMAGQFRQRGIYYLARIIVLFIFVSLIFFPSELQFALDNPTILALLIVGPFVLAVTLLVDLLLAHQRSLSSLVTKYFFLTLSLILLFGLFFFINATRLQPPGLLYMRPGQMGENLNLDAFYFSATTYFTIGYGDIVPLGPYARLAAVFEAFSGGLINLVVLAMAFQRFSTRYAHKL